MSCDWSGRHNLTYFDLERLVKNNKSFQCIILDETKLEDDGAITVATLLEKYKTGILNLSIQWNDIGCEGASAIADMLKINTELQTLWISHNRILDDGVIALASVLSLNTTLQELCLRDNSITDVGMIQLAHALKTNTSLKYLDVSDNTIAITNLLTTNSTLEYLDISECLIDDNGLIAIADALKINTTLKHLNISRNAMAFDPTGIHALVDSLKFNASLTSLYFKQMFIRNEVSDFLVEALAINTTLLNIDEIFEESGEPRIKEYLTRNRVWATDEVDTKPACQSLILG